MQVERYKIDSCGENNPQEEDKKYADFPLRDHDPAEARSPQCS